MRVLESIIIMFMFRESISHFWV